MINNLALLRKQKGFTQAELGEKIGKSAGYISFLENGRSPLKEDVRDRLCEVLECKPEDLSDDKLTVRSGNVEGVVERIKQLRQERGMSQRAFAKAAGCAKGIISEIEAGSLKPSDQTLTKISTAFGVSNMWLLTGEEYSSDQVDEDMEVISKYLRSNDLAREQVLSLIKDGRFEK